MALKDKVTQEEFDKLHSHFKPEYTQQADGGYLLNVEGREDVGALKRAKDHEVSARKEAEAKAREATELAATRQEELDQMRRGAIPKTDVEALELSWKNKLTAAEAKTVQEVAKRDKALQAATADSAAKSIATTISTIPDLLAPMIRSRLAVELTDDGAIVRVLDVHGKPSALTVEDLTKEFKENAAYSGVMIGSKASGGGAGGGTGGGANGKKLSEMSEAERIAFHKADPEGFKRLPKT